MCFRYGSEVPISFVNNRRVLMESLDRDGAPVRPPDIKLLEDEIQRAHQYMEQARKLQLASQRNGQGLQVDDDGITTATDAVCR